MPTLYPHIAEMLEELPYNNSTMKEILELGVKTIRSQERRLVECFLLIENLLTVWDSCTLLSMEYVKLTNAVNALSDYYNQGQGTPEKEKP